MSSNNLNDKYDSYDIGVMLGILEEYAKEDGVSITCSEEAEYQSMTKEVTYDRKVNDLSQIYEILHELGHHLVHKNSKERLDRAIRHKRPYNDLKYVTQVLSDYDRRKRKSMRYRIEILREEFDAWERGYNLAERLGLDIDYDDYHKEASKYIATYCDWIAKRDWSDNEL